VRPHGLVCAHRGASLELRDNSVEAFVAAIASGCEAIETDVRLREDGTLVLAHDTWDVVDPDVVPLTTLLDLAHGQVGLDLEIVEFGLERALVDLIDGFPGWLIITSTFPEVLAEVAGLVPTVPTGLVVEAPYPGGPHIPDPFAAADACGARITLVEDELATPGLIARAGAEQRPFWVWTVNEPARTRELLAQPAVTGIITDDPASACAVRDAAHLDSVDGAPRHPR
jgi:glycerophosphoryl diester phosphodiesterase